MKIYANYCVLESFEIDDNATEDEILETIKEKYAKRGFNFDDFDDGEWDAV